MSDDNEDFGWALIGGLGGGVIGYLKGHSDGYQKAKSEDASYIRSLENENSRVLSDTNQLMTQLLQERKAKAELQNRLDKLSG